MVTMMEKLREDMFLSSSLSEVQSSGSGPGVQSTERFWDHLCEEMLSPMLSV